MRRLLALAGRIWRGYCRLLHCPECNRLTHNPACKTCVERADESRIW